MNLKELVKAGEQLLVGAIMNTHLKEYVPIGRASLDVHVRRATDWQKIDTKTFDAAKLDPVVWAKLEAKGAVEKADGIWVPNGQSYIDEETEKVWNQITNSGRDFLHQQGYQGTGASQGSYTAGNGLNYIALTNTAVTPAAGDTTLSGEIVANGLARAQGTVSHTGSTNTTTVANTFTCASAPQAAQAAALFTASSSGTMNHELTFTQRSLQIGDQLVVTYTITLG